MHSFFYAFIFDLRVEDELLSQVSHPAPVAFLPRPGTKRLNKKTIAAISNAAAIISCHPIYNKDMIF
jgi:hypothetical protein